MVHIDNSLCGWFCETGHTLTDSQQRGDNQPNTDLPFSV